MGCGMWDGGVFYVIYIDCPHTRVEQAHVLEKLPGASQLGIT